MNISTKCPTYLILLLCIASLLPLAASCSDDDPEIRTESDLVGVWSDKPDHFLYIKTDTRIYSIYIEEYDGEEVGVAEPDGYAYEPGYNFIVYMNREGKPDIYKLLSLTKEKMEWGWVDNLLDEKYEGMSKTEILGQLLTEADKGFTVDESRIVTYTRVPDSEFQEILRKYDIRL